MKFHLAFISNFSISCYPQTFSVCFTGNTIFLHIGIRYTRTEFVSVYPYFMYMRKSGFPRGIESIEKVLNFKISFQDLEKVLKLAKICITY